MKYCTRCGAQLADEATFCTNCGNQLEQAPNQQYAPQYQQYAPQYQQYPPQYQQGQPVKNGKATASLVCGIISFFAAGLILGIIAIVLAGKSKQEVGYLLPQAKAGRICGIIALVLTCVGAVIAGVLAATGALTGLFGNVRYYY